MKKNKSKYDELPSELRNLVKVSVACLGEVIERELGREAYLRIEMIRKRMASIRSSKSAQSHPVLAETLSDLKKISPRQRIDFATAYTLMLELMNSCENAYRTFRLKKSKPVSHPQARYPMEAIIYVLTAHPTEARTTQNIAIFHKIQEFLIHELEQPGELDRDRLKALLEIAWRVPLVRVRRPKVEDEAEHIYSIALRKENLDMILSVGSGSVPIYLRSWVGGDKDGHPGVDETSLAKSLGLSRLFIYRYARSCLEELGGLLELFSEKKWHQRLRLLKTQLSGLRELDEGDGGKVFRFRKMVHAFKKQYESEFGPTPLPLQRLRQLLHTFPGLVIPLELREDSGLLSKKPKLPAIERMLFKVNEISKGGDPRWYAQGFIVSMTEKLEHLELAAALVVKTLGGLKIPIVPLFEQKSALAGSADLLKALAKQPQFKKALATTWRGQVEVMLGYSDSSKEGGVLPSRLEVASAMRELDRVAQELKIKIIFFHGSGGSVDRGGGPVEDQLASLSSGALRLYKATIQGEMVERNFASPEIAQSQFLKIAKTAEQILKLKNAPKSSSALLHFASLIEGKYRATVASPVFLKGVEQVTPYRFLSLLKMGSRPSKRAGAISVASLRAIPWILCWTQTRVLFPTWWGVGTAWEVLSPKQKNGIRAEYKNNPLFRTYLNALGFTIAKVEMEVFHFYIAQSNLNASEQKEYEESFRNEFVKVCEFYQAITGKKDPLWFRPWLGESIQVRSSMIHPLNLLQMIAEKEKDLALLRLSVTGIASGMLTTG